MQKSNANHSATVSHRRAQASTTLNRRYVRRPTGKMMPTQTAKSTDVQVSIKRSPKITRFGTSMSQQQIQKQKQTQSQQQTMTKQDQGSMQKQMQTEKKQMQGSIQKQMKTQQMGQQQTEMQMKMQAEKKMTQTKMTGRTKIQVEDSMKPVETHPMQKSAQAKMRERQQMMAKQQTQNQRMTAKELKDQAIKKALMSAATADMKEKKMASSQKTKKTKSMGKMRFGFGRVMLALSCATAAVFAIAYFVNLNMPDISLRVAAMQTGINATYPSYVPRDYSVSGITSENGRVVLEFRHTNSDDKFTLEEEASTWDSNALLNNFVKETYRDEYTIIREQGLTIYISGSNAAWVNGGIVYKLKAADGVLTNKQIRSIAVSL